MRSKHYVRWIAPLAILLTGCAATRQYPRLRFFHRRHSLKPTGQRLTVHYIAALPSVPLQLVHKNVLVLSGGGVNGAYTAGVLKGWTDSGTRPQFDVVTGISTGALIAPSPFLARSTMAN